MAVSKRVRFEVFKRDSFQCQYCGRTPPAVVLECDHVTPVAGGGGDRETNLVTSCFDCNRGKSDVPLAQVLPTVAERMEREREIAEQFDKYNKFLSSRRRRETADINEIGRFWFNQFSEEKDKFVFGPARIASIRTFLKRLPKTVILDAMERACAKIPASLSYDDKAFRYFCGICWGKIKAASGEVAK